MAMDDRQLDPRRFNSESWGGPHVGRGPRTGRRGDGDIREDLSEALMHDDYLDASDIEVRVDKGDVTLNGEVDEVDDKLRAEILAQRTRGVGQVRNNLSVRSRNAEGLGPTLGMDVSQA